ncbi:MAG TPA: hypothetical protein VF604_02045 [Pyrinomonadaceae bacterium]|jgi:acyl-CoA synthetase (AMP-forming)/AMP-acid ligase II
MKKHLVGIAGYFGCFLLGIVFTVSIVSSAAERAALSLHAPQAQVIDASGKIFERDRDAENALIAPATGQPFDQKIPAGSEFEKEIVFDLPLDVKNARPDVAEGVRIDKLSKRF